MRRKISKIYRALVSGILDEDKVITHIEALLSYVFCAFFGESTDWAMIMPVPSL